MDTMDPHTITVSVGGGPELDRAALATLLASLPGLRLIPLDATPPPQVILWQAGADDRDLPFVSAQTTILLLVENARFDALPSSVAGLFSREEPAPSLGIAIRQVARGEQYISPSIAMSILQKQQSKTLLSGPQKSAIESLSQREREILGLLSQGLSNKDIAARLYLSVRTVEGHLASIYQRLGVHSRTEAMLIAVQIR